MWPFRRRPRRRAIEQREVARIEFLGEQDGPVERELKAALTALFRATGAVERAYLSRAVSTGGSEPTVVLALAGAPDRRIVQQIAEVFRGLFAREAFLDIVFLTPDLESAAAQRCRPFYPDQP